MAVARRRGTAPPGIEAGPLDGPLMIFIHGWPELGIIWEHQLRHFASAGWRYIAPDLTEEIGISRGAVREAFRRLAAEGMVDLIPNRGATVRRLSCRQVRELFQIRECVEGLAADLAASQIDAGDNRRLFTQVWERVKPTGETLPWPVFMDNNRLYHRTIVDLGDNTQLSELISQLQLPVVMVQVGRAMQPDHAARSHRDHVAIAEAILAGNAAAAEAAMRKHIRGLA